MQLDRRRLLTAAAATPLVAGLPRLAWAATDINYWHHFTSATEFKGLERVMALFKERYPDINLTQENIPNAEWMSKVTAASVSGSKPATAMITADRAPDMVNMGGPIDLTDKIKGWDKFGLYAPSTWEGITVNGKLYGLPLFIFVDWMYYRKDWFDEAGLKAPTNFIEMTEAAVKLTDPSKNRFGFGLRGASGGQSLIMDVFHAYGLEIVKDGKPAMDRAKLVEALDWYSGLYTKLKVAPPSAPNDSYRQIMEGFKTGQTAMIWHHTGSLTELQQAMPEGSFMTATRPAGPARHYARVTYQFNGIMDPSKLDAGWDWLTFWSEADPGIAFLEETGYFPSNPEIAKDDRIQKNPIYAAAVETTRFGSLPTRFPGSPGWEETVVLPEFQRILVGQTTVEAAADAILAGLESTLN
ncbi:MAG TPA: sugar ABC transporter substrate-binding protein [Geminicoccaceae bacterium]|nr:sugar ABC transporter substrate-binding protein [Geminicoccus sp.]HMU48450.1 sugar ABC transporter substrate-binding protein [Geminicoccaceae bacterium]